MKSGVLQILDASVALKWFLKTGENEGEVERAIEVLNAVELNPALFVVPSLFYHETHAVSCRRLPTPKAVSEAMELLWHLGMHCVPWDPEIAQTAAELSFAGKLSAYDATYLAIAQELKGTWVTFDRKAHRQV